MAPDAALGFGYKIDWLATRDRDADAVAAALNLSRPTPATWRDAVTAAYDDQGQWLLTPPLDRWTLAASRDVPVPEDDRFTPWLAALSQLLGEVQYFGTHRVVEYHGWGRARGGVVERAFAYLGERGEVLFDVGERTLEEQALGVGAVSDEDEPWDDDDETSPWPDEETVLTLAGQWSTDPRTLESAVVPGHPWIASARSG
ncbi:hypothetical protein OG992_11845 [Micromonospora sp. NBC_00362]|uniref:hypothetical protein n=1 Tax=Micromonospora sp. NBC_00362 TaxID=2975975 RepID=UPI00224D758D|nr:hypothetical protein [Micromonospora sp. NBC_00362]MCX5117876.1 hypothetical protein [Micromonospora sp. NBC_00362]